MRGVFCFMAISLLNFSVILLRINQTNVNYPIVNELLINQPQPFRTFVVLIMG